MKNLLIVIALAVLAPITSAYDWSPERFYDWGGRVHVDASVIEFAVETDVKAENLVALVEEYAGFECDVTIEQLNEKEVVVSVDWFPGSDLSGCLVVLGTKDGVSLGSTELYMNY